MAKNGVWAVCLKNIDFGPKTKQLRISGDVIELLVIYPSIQDLSLNAICCFFLKAQRVIKTDFGVSKSELENQISFCFAFLLMNFSNYIMGNKRHLPFPSSTLCVVDRSNQYRPHVVSMGYRCDIAVSDEYKNAGKQTILIFWQFLN